MPPTPAPTPPIEVFVHSGGADWWQIFAALSPIAVLVGAFLAAFMAWRTLRQKAAADNRAEWWRRTQWALDHALDTDENTKALGLVTLDVLAHSELARKEELELLDIAWKAVTKEENGSEVDAEEASAPTAKASLGFRLRRVKGNYFVRVSDAGIRKDLEPVVVAFTKGPRPEPSGSSNPSPATAAVDSGENMGDNGPTDKNQIEEG